MDSKFSNQHLNNFEIEEKQQEENSLSINSNILPEQDLEGFNNNLEKEIISMPENNNNVAQDIVFAMTIAMATLLEQQKQQNNNFNNDFFNKPRAYHGERDPQIIDLWIQSIEDYKTFKQYDHIQTYNLAKTLLDHDAKAWLYVVEKDNLGPLDDWGQLKNLIKLTFKPANSIIILRDQLHQLQQKRTISEYSREFLKIKLSISNIKDEEAVSQFVRGLKDPELKLKINRLYRGDNCPPLNEAINEAYLHESSNHAVFYPGFQNSRTIIDDPMDLSVAYQHNNFRGRGGNVSGPPRGGGFPGGFSNRGYHSSAPRGRDVGSFGGGGPPRVCYACGEPGHIQYYCPRNNQNQKLNYMHSDNGNNDYYTNEKQFTT